MQKGFSIFPDGLSRSTLRRQKDNLVGSRQPQTVINCFPLSFHGFPPCPLIILSITRGVFLLNRIFQVICYG